MLHGPWTSGPSELLDHAKDHLAKGTDVDNRFAMISVDNAVELMLSTYLHLPKSVTALDLTQTEKQEFTRYFPTLLWKVNELVPDRLSAVPLPEIEWFHHIRNQLYHQGNVLTVERDKVGIYLKHAETLMSSLFPEPLPRATPRQVRYQQFFDKVRSEILSSEPHFTRAKALPQTWWATGVGRVGFYLEVSFAKNHTLRVMITIDTKDKRVNNTAFEQLHRKSEAIEKQLGQKLVWDALPSARACHIYAARDGTIDDGQERLDQLIQWAAPSTIKFREVFQPLIKNLDLGG
jgi:hypothetical protein